MTSNLSDRISGLSPEKRALLERHLIRRAAAAADEGIPVRADLGPVPLSFSQQRLWFLEQLAPGSPTYNAVLLYRLSGALDVAALTAAFRTVIGRHEALRTVFREVDAAPVQVVLSEWDFAIVQVDLRSAADPEFAMRTYVREESRRSFRLTDDLMLRVSLVRVSEQEWVLALVEHHIAFDGWSDEILFDELSECYAAELEGRRAELPELPVQYADFSVWQRNRLSGSELERQVDYWRSALTGAPTRLELPFDHPRPPVQTFAGKHEPVQLPSLLAERAAELGKSEGATPYMIFLAAFVTLLARWSRETDVLVGTPIANRGRVELERLIGFFSNTLVLRVRPHLDSSFRDLVRRVREVALGAYEHQDLPFDEVVKAVAPARDASCNPLFQVNFRLTMGVSKELNLRGLVATPFELDIGFSRFDLALELQLNGQGIGGYLEYNEALFEGSTAIRLIRHLEALVTDALARPDVPLSQLAMWEPPQAGIRGARTRAGARPT